MFGQRAETLDGEAAKGRAFTFWFACLILIYLSLHAVIRLLQWHSLEYDEAEQLYFAQTMAWGYSGQPPLYTWLIALLVKLTGSQVLALVILKFTLLAAVYFLLYDLALRFIQQKHLAFAVAITPWLMPVFAWESIRLMTHTTLLCACSLATLSLMLRIREKQRTSDYLLLGITLACGFLAKYNFLLFVAALGIAVISVSEYRRLLFTPKILATVSIGAFLVLPHLLWVITYQKEIASTIQTSTGAINDSYWKGLPLGFWNLIKTLLLGLAPLLCVGVVFFYRNISKVRTSEASAEIRLLKLFLVITLGLFLLLVLLGAKTFRLHWLGPFLLLLPIALLTHFRPIDFRTWRYRGFLGTAVGMTLVILCIRAATLGPGYEAGKFQTRDFLYAQLAAQVKDGLVQPKMIVTMDPIIAGYQCLHFPETTCRCLKYEGFTKVGSMGDSEPMILVWDATNSDTPVSSLAGFVPFANFSEATYFTTTPRFFPSSTKRLGMLVYPNEKNVTTK